MSTSEASGNTTPTGPVVSSTSSVEKKENKNLPPKLLEPKQWTVWSKKMELHLKSLGIWDIVDGSRAAPVGDEEKLKTYNKEKNRAHSDLLKCIGEKFEGIIVSFDSSKKVWTCLKELCQQAKATQLFHAEQQLENLQPLDTVTDTLLHLKRLIQEIETNGGKLTANQQVLKLLKLLPETYTELKLQVQTTDTYKVESDKETFDFEKVFNAVYKRALITETLNSKDPKQNPSVFLTATESQKKPFFKRKGKPRNPQGNLTCSICKERGHLAKDCKTCAICLKNTHRTHQCYRLPEIQEQYSNSNSAQNEDQSNRSSSRKPRDESALCISSQLPEEPAGVSMTLDMNRINNNLVTHQSTERRLTQESGRSP